MEIQKILSFLVHPGKGQEDQPSIGGTFVPLNGNLYQMLSRLFIKSVTECNIEISFNPAPDGSQQNDCRDEIITLLNEQSAEAGRKLAQRLQNVTTHRSGLGLLFLIVGRNDHHRRMLVSRFPADYGILAEENQTNLRVEFLEKVFMRNALSYKAVLYEGDSLDSDFWTGRAIDRQVNSNLTDISNYWIREFLISDFMTTPAAGTRRLAIALKEAMRSGVSLQSKEEISAAARLAQGLDGQTISINDVAERFRFSDETQIAVNQQIKHTGLSSDHFIFSTDEFRKVLPYRSLELNNGAILTATVQEFDECFQKEEIQQNPGEFKFITQGSIVDDLLRKTK